VVYSAYSPWRPRTRSQVGIVGAGPAGLLPSHPLHVEGLASVVLDIRGCDYVEKRIRAGVLAQGTVDLLIESGVGDRMQRECLVHHGIELRFGGRGRRIGVAAPAVVDVYLGGDRRAHV